MKRTIAGAVIASLTIAGAAVPATVGAKAAKKPSPRAKVLKGKLAPVPVGDYGMLANSRGHFQAVDGKRNDKISIHVRRLSPGTTYTWRIVEAAAGAESPCASGTPVEGWTYKPLTANKRGNANSKGKSRTFKYNPEKSYYVGVYLADGNAFLCGELRGKKVKSKAKSKGKSGDKPAAKNKAKGPKAG